MIITYKIYNLYILPVIEVYIGDVNVDKIKILDAIREKSIFFKKVSPIRYRMRCPFCGDSQKDMNTGHMYLKCEMDPISPILYYCFKANCQAKGVVDEEFLKLMDIDPNKVGGIDEVRRHNKLSSYRKSTNIDVGIPYKGKQYEYLQYRLNIPFDIEELSKFKIIWDVDKFKSLLPNRLQHRIVSAEEGISFLSTDQLSIMTRFYQPKTTPWLKQRLDNSEDKILYTIKSDVDLFSEEPITIFIAEGIITLISVYHNFKMENSVYIATLGARYDDGIVFLIDKGIYGENVNIHLYVDNNITISHVKSTVKKYRWLYNEIVVFQNMRADDFGVPSSQIERVSEVI